MLKLQTTREVWIDVPLPEAADAKSFKLKVALVTTRDHYRAKHQNLTSVIDTLQKQAEDGNLDDVRATLAKLSVGQSHFSQEALDAEFARIKSRARDWQGVADADGQPAPFSPDALDAVLNIGEWLVAAVASQLNVLDTQGRTKNS